MSEDVKNVEQNTEDMYEQDKQSTESEAKYTDEDINRIIGQKFAKWQREKEREISEAQKLAEMNAQERAEHERDELQRKLDELIEKESLGQMQSEARKELAEAGINVADDLLCMLVSTDAEKTRNSVKAFKTMFQSAVSVAVKEALRGNTPKGKTTNGLTKEQILNVADRRERQRLMNENQNLFKTNGGN